MDATFFTTDLDRALGVFTYDDLPVDPAGDPVRVPSPAFVLALAELLGGDRAPCARPLRDATCRSFPIWDLGPEVSERLARAGDAEIDALAAAWLASGDGVEADAYELALLLAEIRAALQCCAAGERLFVLLEERAF